VRDRDLEALLARYVPGDDSERAFLARMRELARLERSCERSSFAPGHFTASAFVLSPERDALLLVFHTKLRIWVQPGGHVEPSDENLERAAEREVEEETGVRGLVRTSESAALFDLDIHAIPPWKLEPAHEHFDVRFAFIAPSRTLAVSDELDAARWVPFADVERANSDRSVLRAAQKLVASLR